ncbi:MAG: 1-deoxy-D-xylulose-5-phosphate reductoisomerase [Acidobacteria bacterium]|nr:1-deoxy-D-xylulose-5-phosphate reductoisomerase [Acidobacteriota bacterium]
MKKKVVILGSTGSIGKSTLDVVEHHKDEFQIVALAANRSVAVLAQQVKKYKPEFAAVFNEEKHEELVSLTEGSDVETGAGMKDVIRAATFDADIVVAAIAGSAGLIPTYEAIKKGRVIALANKETLVMGGQFIIDEARKYGAALLPVDSEHSAVFQSLLAGKKVEIRRIILTASGGPFYNYTLDDLKKVKPADALKHPVWDMGAKITIDSSSMANKGLEVIEAVRLFDIEPDKVEVVIHPQSFIHSMVEYTDSSIIAQMGEPDMRTPIQYALTYPDRITGRVKPFSFENAYNMQFLPPKNNIFPALDLAYHALKKGEYGPICYNAADEIAVEAFMKEIISFTDIPVVIEETLETIDSSTVSNIDDILKIDSSARKMAKEIIKKISVI